MHISISIPPALANVAGTVSADSLDMSSLTDAIYHSVHGYPGGVSALAEVLGVPAGTLTHKANPNNSSHFMRPEELLLMQVMSGNVAVLHAMAAKLGYACHAALPVVQGGGAVHAFMRLQLMFGEFVRQVAEPLARMEASGDYYPSTGDVRRADVVSADLHAAITHMVSTLRACKRPAPKEA